MLPKKLPRRLCVPTTSTQALGTSNGNEAPTSQGWALKGQKTATNTSKNVKRFPIAKFNEDLRGQKAKSQRRCRKLRTRRVHLYFCQRTGKWHGK